MTARTAEQVAADTALRQAIEAVNDAYSPEDAEVLTDFVVVAAWDTIDPDGDVTTTTSLLVNDGSLPAYRVRGLLVHALARMQAHSTALEVLDDNE